MRCRTIIANVPANSIMAFGLLIGSLTIFSILSIESIARVSENKYFDYEYM